MSSQLIESLKLAAGSFCDLFITGENSSQNSRRRRPRPAQRFKRLRVERLEPLTMLSGTTLDPSLDSTATTTSDASALVASPMNATAADTIVSQASPIILSTAGQTYQLQTSLRFTDTGFYIAAPNVTLDLNGHTIYYGSGNTNTVNNVLLGARGVVLYLNYFHTNLAIPNATTPNNAIIKNGSIVDESNGALSHAIEGRTANNLLIQNIRAEVNGTDSATVAVSYGSITITNSVLIDHTVTSFNRHQGPANVKTDHATLIAHGNVLIGGNSGFNVGNGSQITGNVISHSGPVTNGYGVFLYYGQYVTVTDNLILPSNGRGVLMNGGLGNRIENNVILHLEEPNLEFGEALNPPAIRSRYDSYGHTVSGNTSLGIAGADRTSASGLYLSDDGAGAGSVYENNNMTTILVGTRDASHYAQPLTLEKQGYVAESQDVIRNNVFRSNDSLIRVQGWDGSSSQAPLTGNSLSWVDGNTAEADFMAAVQQKLIEIGLASNADAIAVVNSTDVLIHSLIAGIPLSPERAAWFVKYYSNVPVFATALDSQWASGVAPDSYAYWTLNEGSVSVRVGQGIPAILVDASGDPIANVAVQVITDRGDIYNLTSDAVGKVALPVIEFGLDKAYAAGSLVVKNGRTTTTLTVSGYAALTLNNDYLLPHKLDASPLTIALVPLVDTTPPMVTSFSPASGATSVPTNATLTVVFSEVLSASTINTSTMLLMEGSTAVASSVAYNATNKSATLTPSSTLATSKTYTLLVKGGASGVKDLAGNTLAADATASFTTTAAANQTPAAVNNSYATNEDTVLTVVAAGVLSNDSDTDGNPLSAVRVTDPSHGTLSLNANGSFSYSPAANYNGTDSFTYLANDGTANSNTATVSITIQAVNDAPAGANKTVTTLEDIAYTFAVADFGFSDPSDLPANALLAVKIASLPTAGALTNNGLAVSAGQFISAIDIAVGKLKFAPAANAWGTNYANFTFQVQDNGGTANGVTDLDPGADFIMVNVTAVDDAPAGANKTVTILEDTTYTFAVADFGFSDPFDSPANALLAVKIANPAAAGILTNNGLAVSAGQFISAADIAAGKLKFAPAANASGTNYASFNFHVQDNGGTANGGIDLDPAADFIMVNVTPIDTIAPTVTAFSPTNGAVNVPTSSAAMITFSEALNASTVNAGSVFLRDASNTVVATTLSYDAATKRVTLTPTGPLSNSTAYTIVVKGGSAGVKDMAGNSLAADVLSSFTTAAPITAASLWTPSVIPTTVDSGDGKAVELGVKFTSDVNGYITGVRFYKSAANTGTHLGSLWTANGQRLATATFTNETASGWQQVNFSTPIAITAGTTYLASYHTNVGHYSKTQSYFSSQFNSGPLHVAANGGVYLYGSGGFPTKTFQGSNYWVDVVLSDTIAPTVTAFSPTNGAVNVPTSSAAMITFSEALNASTVNAGSVFLRDASNTVVATTLSYDAATKRVTLTPTGPLSNSTAYTIVVKGGSAGVKDMAGNSLAADVLSSFTTAAPITAASLWTPSVIPTTVDSGDGKAVELGVKFTSDVNGYITGVRFYKSAANTGTHLGSLWTANGQRLATATFTNETASGWQQVNFSTPIAITAGTTYLASYHTNVGHYSKTQSYFSSQFNSGPLHVAANGGVYLYGSGGFPTKTFQGSNYWVDVVLSDTIAPTVTAFSPTNGAVNVPTSSAAMITFSEALNASTVNAGSVFLRDASNTVVATTLSYDAATKRVTLTPTGPLSNSTAYTIVVKGGSAGVKDMAGNSLAADVLSSFTTAAPITAPVRLWENSATPAIIDVNDTQSVELGTKFTADVNGTVNGARFYKSAANTGTHTASLWTAAGQLLATATFTNETASGWQQVNFSTPVAITAGTTYVISYHTNVGHYSKTLSYFSSQFNSGYLHVPANGGVYRYGTSGLPNQTDLASNYWVDVLFIPFGI